MRQLAWTDLEHYDWLSVPVWACEVATGRVRWANAAAISAWGAEPGELSDLVVGEGLRLAQEDLLSLWQEAGQGEGLTIAGQLCQGLADRDLRLQVAQLVLPDGQAGLCLQAQLQAPATIDPLALRGVEAVLHFSLAVVMFDLQGRVLMQNPFALRAFPILGQLESGGFADLLDNKAEAEQVWRNAIEFGADQGERQFSARPKPRWYAYSLHRVLDPVTGEKAMLLTAQDVTERVQSEQKFRVLFEQAANPLLLFDPAIARVVDCNRAAALALRLASRRQLIDTDPARFYPERQPDGSDSRQQAAALLEEAGRRGWQRFEWLFLRTDGSELLVEITLSPVSVGDRKLLLMAWYDLSFRRLIERQLRDAKDEAEAASRAKSQFLANMSHEIRTPLNVITGMTGLLLDGEMPPQQRQRLELVHFSAAGLVELVDDILDFSRIEAGRLTILPTVCDLHALLHRTTELLRYSAEQTGLQLALQLAPAVPRYVEADEGRLRQVLLNLAGNAIKFTARGSVSLQVDWLEEGGTAPRLNVVVADTGIGIEADKLDMIFEPFAQGDDSTSRRHGGSGLGLTITRRIVEAMQGYIGVLSQPGVGSRFCFEIPLRPSAPPQETATQGHHPVRPLRILLAEDNPMNQTLALALLEQDGHQVTLANNGKEALAYVEREGYDLVLMDMQMPEMDGLSATLAIRALGERGRLPIVAMTANVLPEDKARCLAAGMDDFLSKPIKVERLRQLLYGVAEYSPVMAGTASDAMLFDAGQALLICGGNAGLLATLLDQYLEEWPGRQAALQAVWASGDMAGLAELAHLFKGSLGALGAMPGVMQAQAIEQAARAGALDAATYDDFLALLAQCAEQFGSYRAANPGSAHATQ
ncbi:hybrid sensor histidine kinase/response regulator [Chitinimonas sp.]|uniref:hybrid sensor histidine kinase/response regulator n=1 Tax=Chitinimonas sp. TaxID=1934313 RepID=UPI002F958CA1